MWKGSVEKKQVPQPTALTKFPASGQHKLPVRLVRLLITLQLSHCPSRMKQNNNNNYCFKPLRRDFRFVMLQKIPFARYTVLSQTVSLTSKSAQSATKGSLWLTEPKSITRVQQPLLAEASHISTQPSRKSPRLSHQPLVLSVFCVFFLS